MDMAISLSREGRYAGAGVHFWPVALHCFVVCDLLRLWGFKPLLLDGLLHDSSETYTGDAPKPVKTDEFEMREREFMAMNYRAFGLKLPSAHQHSIIKRADTAAKHGEVYTVGTQALQKIYPRHRQAERLVEQYFGKYTYNDMLDASGRVPIEFMHRFWVYRDMPESRHAGK